MPATPVFNLPYPLATDPADIPADLQRLVVAVEAALQTVVAPPALPAGAIVFHGGTVAPAGYLVCNGAAVSRTTYAPLFLVIGIAWNIGGEAITVFRLPDLQGRLPVGVGTHADVAAVGMNDGTALASRRPRHRHTVSDPGHTHAYTSAVGGPPTAGGGQNGVALGASVQTGSTGTGVAVGPAGSPLDSAAYAVGTWMIKT